MLLDELPSEILHHVVYLLCGEDILEFRRTNKRLHGMCEDPPLWYNVIERSLGRKKLSFMFDLPMLSDYKLEDLKIFYINIVKKWGWLLGLWKREMKKFGGMMQVKLQMNPSQIVAYDIQAKEFIVCPVPLFTIPLYPSSSNKIECSFYPTLEHCCTISQEGDNGIFLSCRVADMKKYHDFDRAIINSSQSLGMNNESIHRKLIAAHGKFGGVKFKKIEEDLESYRYCCIKSGYFIGDYSAHKYEVLSLQSTEKRIFLSKISGDEYVRSGSVSIDIDTSHAIDYVYFLGYVIDHLHRLDMRKAIADTLIPNSETPEPKLVPHQICDILHGIGGRRTFGLSEEGSYIAAFKGQITLGRSPYSDSPHYFYRDVVVVIMDNDTLAVYVDYSSNPVGIGEEMVLKRSSVL